MARSRTDVSYKIVLTGQFGVGKSAIFRRFVSDSFTDDDDQQQQQQQQQDVDQRCDNNNYNKVLCRSMTATVPAPDNYSRQFTTANTRRTVQLELWGTAGMERFCTMSGNYYANASAVLIVYAQDSQNSFNEAVECVLEAIEAAGRSRLAVPCGLVVFLCANKSDLAESIEPPAEKRDRQWVSDESVKKLVQQFDEIICGKYLISCRTGTGVEAMFEDIVEVLDSRAQDKAERTTRFILGTNGKHQEAATNGRTETRACQCN